MAEIHGDYFNYFAYGSNLLKERIHVQIKGAEFVCAGRLEHYELFFAGASQRWRGAAASIRELKGDEVIVNGAIEHGLPPSYIDRLKHIKDNGYRGTVDVNISFLRTLL